MFNSSLTPIYDDLSQKFITGNMTNDKMSHHTKHTLVANAHDWGFRRSLELLVFSPVLNNGLSELVALQKVSACKVSR